MLFIIVAILLLLMSLYAFFVPKPGGLILKFGSICLFIVMVLVAISLNSQGWFFYLIILFSVFVLIGNFFDQYNI